MSYVPVGSSTKLFIQDFLCAFVTGILISVLWYFAHMSAAKNSSVQWRCFSLRPRQVFGCLHWVRLFNEFFATLRSYPTFNMNATVSKDKHINETRYWFSFIWDIIKSIQGMRWKLKDVKTFLPGHPRSRFFDGYAARGSILLDYHEDAKK